MTDSDDNVRNVDHVNAYGDDYDTVIVSFSVSAFIDATSRAETNAVLETIVRDLAATSEPIYDSTCCVLCDGLPDEHAETCLWRRSVEWVAAHPEGDSE